VAFKLDATILINPADGYLAIDLRPRTNKAEKLLRRLERKIRRDHSVACDLPPNRHTRRHGIQLLFWGKLPR